VLHHFTLVMDVPSPFIRIGNSPLLPPVFGEPIK